MGKRRQRRKAGSRTRKLAEAALRELIAEVDSGTYVPRSGKTVGSYLADWPETVRPRLRPTTWNSYRIAAARITSALGNTLVQSLTPLDAERFYAALLAGADGARPLSPNSVRNTHIVLRKAMSDAERLGLVPRVPAASAKLVRMFLCWLAVVGDRGDVRRRVGGVIDDEGAFEVIPGGLLLCR